MKRWIAAILAVLICVFYASALADRIPEPKGKEYIGAMQVVYCKEFVTLRELPKKTSSALARVPLGSIVFSCRECGSVRFLQCEFEGQTGYILWKYLKAAPKYEPPESSAITRTMTREEIIGNGEIVLDWEDYNIAVLAAREYTTEKKKPVEVMRIGCFLNGEPIWGHIETVEVFSEHDMLHTFIGGMEDDPQVMIYDGGYGLTMIDLLNGKDKWSMTIAKCPLGDAAFIAVDDSGNMYIAGSDGPYPVAVSPEGKVLWTADLEGMGLYDPYIIQLKKNRIEMKYISGKKNGYKLVTLDNNTGEIIELKDVRDTEFRNQGK